MINYSHRNSRYRPPHKIKLISNQKITIKEKLLIINHFHQWLIVVFLIVRAWHKIATIMVTCIFRSKEVKKKKQILGIFDLALQQTLQVMTSFFYNAPCENSFHCSMLYIDLPCLKRRELVNFSLMSLLQMSNVLYALQRKVLGIKSRYQENYIKTHSDEIFYISW